MFLVGIVSRRDLLRALVRPDGEIRTDVLRLVEGYTGELGSWQVTVVEGVVSIKRTRGTPEGSADDEQRTLRTLAQTVPGVIGARVVDPAADAQAAR